METFAIFTPVVKTNIVPTFPSVKGFFAFESSNFSLAREARYRYL